MLKHIISWHDASLKTSPPFITWSWGPVKYQLKTIINNDDVVLARCMFLTGVCGGLAAPFCPGAPEQLNAAMCLPQPSFGCYQLAATPAESPTLGHHRLSSGHAARAGRLARTCLLRTSCPPRDRAQLKRKLPMLYWVNTRLTMLSTAWQEKKHIS